MGGAHMGGGHMGGGPHATRRGAHLLGRQSGPLTRQSTTLKGSAITPATSLQHPFKISARPFSLHLGAHMGGGHMGGGPHMGGGHIGGGPHVGGMQAGGGHIGGGQTGPPAKAGMAATIIKRPAKARMRSSTFLFIHRLLPKSCAP